MHNIDEASYFAQAQISQIYEAILAHHWAERIYEQWRWDGYKRLMIYLLEDDNHDPKQRQEAVVFVTGTLKGHLARRAAYTRKYDKKESDAHKEICFNLAAPDFFIEQCRKREEQIKHINEELLNLIAQPKTTGMKL